METPKNNIGETIRKYRELKDLSQDKLGELVGKSQQTIGRYERGETIPSLALLDLIFKVLEIPADTYFNQSKENVYVGETKNKTYIDKPLKELTDLVIREREFLEKIGFFEFLKSIPEMTDEDKKFNISVIKNFFKLIKRSNKNGS